MVDGYETVETHDSELSLLVDLIDTQFQRIDDLFRDGNIEETTYETLTLALINKINIIAVEEVLTTDAQVEKDRNTKEDADQVDSLDV